MWSRSRRVSGVFGIYRLIGFFTVRWKEWRPSPVRVELNKNRFAEEEKYFFKEEVKKKKLNS